MKVLKKNFFLIIIFTATLFFTVGCGNVEEVQNTNEDFKKVRMMIMTSGTDSGINTKVAKKISDEMKKETGGNVVIEIYPNDKLTGGNTGRGVQMVVNGSADMAVYTSGTFSMLDPEIALPTLPWVFTNYEDVRQIMNDTGDDFYRKIFAENGLVYLGATHNGFRQISNNRNPVHNPEDLSQMKIRILGNDVCRRFFQALGADPIPMSRSEMEIGLKEGTIDGHDMGLHQSGSANLDKIERYVTLLNYSYENYIFVINTKIFNQLEPRTRELLLKKSKEACEWGCDIIEKSDHHMKYRFKKNGVQITELTPQEFEIFKNKTRPMLEELKTQYSEDALKAFKIDR